MQTTSADGLIPISSATLVAGVWPCLNIYLRSDSSAKPVLFHCGDNAPEGATFDKLSKSSNCKLYIDKNARSAYQSYLRQNWQTFAEDTSKPLINRVGVISDVMRDVLSEEFARNDTDRIVKASRGLASTACNLIAESPIMIGELLRVMQHDYGTFTHSTNVSMFCVMLARELDLPESDIEEIAVGALVHDLGKLRIDEAILNKPGRLSESEFRVVQEHPTIGYRQLHDRQDLSFGQLMMVYQHHEKVNGSGYPVGCLADEIHPWARICTVVDVYEALTSARPYRQPASRSTALAILDRGDGTEFDPEVLAGWRSVLQKSK